MNDLLDPRNEDYLAFLKAKVCTAPSFGFEIADADIHPILKPHQRAAVRWAVRGGRRALFESFGLGKSVQQLEVVRLVRQHAGGRGLIVCPLGVRQEFVRDAAMLGTRVQFIRRIEDAVDDPAVICLTNYETVRDGKLDPKAFSVVSLDEAAVLRGFGGTRTFRELMAIFAGDDRRDGGVARGPAVGGVPYRFVATAVPSPNEFVELLAYAAYLGVMEVSQAKAQPLDAKVLTPSGWRLMGDLATGDAVLAGDGSPTRVLGVYPQGERPIYQVTFSDGASAECDAEHLWLTHSQYERNNDRRRRARGRMDSCATVKTTAQIAATLRHRRNWNHSVPVIEGAARLFSQRVDIEPWLMGALLGDACIRETSVTFSTMDEWMVERVRETLPAGLFLRLTARGECDYGITSTGRQGGNGPGSNLLLVALRKYGLTGKRSWEKRVPPEYLFNAADVRLAVLRGLMDTDGTVDKANGATFTSTSHGLAEDLVFLVRSLGGVATVRGACPAIGRAAYRVRVNLPENPFSLPRKADRWRPRPVVRYITSVEYVGMKAAQCIAIDHPSRLYVTDDFAVTHNTRFFKRDSEKADNLTLYEHKVEEFWAWVSSWAVFVTRPSDIDPGFSDEGYDLPPLTVRWHEIGSDHESAGHDADGQARLYRDAALGVTQAAREKRDSLTARVAKLRALIDERPGDHAILWHDLEAERAAIKAALPEAVDVYGSQELEERERRVADFADGRSKYLAGKPVMLGSGTNLQRHCHWAIFVGVGFKFSEFIQALHRIFRFGQAHPCVVDIIHTEAERRVVETLKRKWTQHEEMVRNMTELIRKRGLSFAGMMDALTRSMGVERVEVAGEGYRLVNTDCVLEARRMEPNSVGLVVTSIPFSQQYEYSPNYADLGHSDNNEHFFRQLDFLTPELLRVLQPGRIAAVHVKDRIVPGGMTGLGFQTVYPFHARCIDHFVRHGFAYMGMKTIVTDVVRENNQTYRLGWSEQCKDGTKMGVGMPEYLLLFRKPPTDTSNSYADVPVVKSKPDSLDASGNAVPFDRDLPMKAGTGYSRSRWQIDAHGFARSSGDRRLTPEELEHLEHDGIFQAFKRHSLESVYDFEYHVRLGESLEVTGRLPVTFMLLQPQSWSPDVWTDIARMRTLNTFQAVKGKEQHLCLARDSRVLTKERGYIPIQDVLVGEHALTHLGRWRRVLVVSQTGTRRAVTVRAHGCPGLTLTPDHKLWSRKSEWVRERAGAERVDPGWIEAQDVSGGYVNLKLPPTEEPSISDLLHWWVVGRWIANGHWEKRGAAMISCGAHEVEGLRAALGPHAGGVYDTGTAHQIRVLDPARTIKGILRRCRRGAADKQLPPEAFSLPAEQARALLDGYLSGDGHLVEGRNRWQVTAVGRDILLGLAMLAQRAYGAIASVYPGRPERQAVIAGRTVHCKQEWVFCFDLPVVRRQRPFILEDGAWKRVRSVEDAGDVETWNMRVEEDESYTAEGCIVKNCPLPLDLVDRVIAQMSNQGDVVFDPFGGLLTVAERAIRQRRRAITCELSARYFLDGVSYCRAAWEETNMPTLFDLIDEASA